MPDREKIEEWAMDFKSFVYDLDIPRDDYRGIIEYINDAFALLIDQDPVKPIKDASTNILGKWIRLTGMAPPEYHGHRICSVCESFAPYDPLHPGREQLSPYCPGCGAKMEVGEDD